MKYDKIMQCKPYTENKIKFPVYAQVKMNGIFGRYDKDTSKFYTRSGNIIQGLSTLETEMKELNTTFDSELVIPGMNFFEMNGLIRSFNETPDCVAYVFDMPNSDTLKERLKGYWQLLAVDNNFPHVIPVGFTMCTTQTQLDTFYDYTIKDYEGIVFKTVNSKYYKGKRWTVQKRVPEFSTECPIIGFQEGTKSFAGMLGAFIVDYNGTKVKVGNGMGLDHLLRTRVWRNKGNYINRSIKIAYKSITKNGSLQSPKFIGFRWDLNETT